MTRKDIILLAVIVAAAGIMALFLKAWSGQDGGSVVVTVDGAFYGEYSLFEDKVIEVEGVWGYNRIVIENGSAYMQAADCPDKYCMTYQPISKTNQSIICLPHQLVVQVADVRDTDETGSVPDVIVQ